MIRIFFFQLLNFPIVHCPETLLFLFFPWWCIIFSEFDRHHISNFLKCKSIYLLTGFYHHCLGNSTKIIRKRFVQDSKKGLIRSSPWFISRLIMFAYTVICRVRIQNVFAVTTIVVTIFRTSLISRVSNCRKNSKIFFNDNFILHTIH
uniref:Putative secreted protein n=1 Tax=Anopheles marajoara TaxID=58244 RepID=A0A2M4C6K3_9DIPT